MSWIAITPDPAGDRYRPRGGNFTPTRIRIAEGLRDGPTGAVSVVRRLLHRRDVRRVELAYAGFISAEFGTWVAILVYAYEHGGATAAALAALAQLLPASVAAPLLSRLVDRRGGAPVLRLGYLCQAAGFCAVAALILPRAPPVLVYAAAIATACTVTMTRPAQAALIPSLVRDADELTAINTFSGWSEAISDLAGTAWPAR